MDGSGFGLKELTPFAGAVIAGAVGGCVASIQHARTRRETVAAFAIGYMILGVYGGLMASAAAFIFYPSLVSDWPQLFLIAGVAGVVVAGAGGLGNLTMRFALNKLGLDVTIDVKRRPSKKEGE